MEVEWGKNISMDQNKMVKVLNPYLMGINETLEHALRALEAVNNLGNHEVLEAASQKQRLSSANKEDFSGRTRMYFGFFGLSSGI